MHHVYHKITKQYKEFIRLMQFKPIYQYKAPLYMHKRKLVNNIQSVHDILLSVAVSSVLERLPSSVHRKDRCLVVLGAIQWL